MKKLKSGKNLGLGFKLLSIALLLFTIWIFLAPLFAERLIVEKPLEKADAILVLSGSSAYIERTHKAAELYRRGVSEKILLTDDGGHAGWSKTEQRNPKFVELAKRELIAQGVRADDIEILSEQVTGTIYEARALQKALEERGWRRILLVTSAYHTRRALWTFKRVLDENKITVEIGIIPAPSGTQTSSEYWWLKREGWKIVAGEYIKSAAYWIYY